MVWFLQDQIDSRKGTKQPDNRFFVKDWKEQFGDFKLIEPKSNRLNSRTLDYKQSVDTLQRVQRKTQLGRKNIQDAANAGN